MSDSVPFWLHILAAAVWVGPQFFMFLVTVPALRAIDDPEVRLRVLRIIATRFGWLAWAALLVLVLSGISSLYDRIDDGFDVFDRGQRYYWIFNAKMMLLFLAVVTTALHSFVIGPRQIRLQEEAIAAGERDPEGAAALRRLSIALSGVTLLASVAILYTAALLANHSFSIQPV
ncbi:MAG: hypothetical protein HYS09_01840 [Chloroflexi bacterium]|nr:hypothetical protein [Chloroflexota bacterium]